MPYLLGLIGLATAAWFLVMRARRGAEMAHDLLDVADDIRSAARRFGFRRRTQVHPVEAIEDPRLAIGGLASAFIQLDDLPTTEIRQAMDVQLRKQLNLSAEEAQEIEILGQWFVSECNGPDAAVPRLSRKLARLSGAEGFTQLMAVIQGIAGASGGALSPRQGEALDEIRKAFRIT